MERKTKKPVMKKMTIKLGMNAKARYTEEDLVDMLSNISFELINISLTTKKTYIGINGLGYASIGFINGFNSEEKSFDVVLFENRVKDIEKLGDVVVTTRAFTDKESRIVKIIGLDVEPVSVE